MRPLLSTLIVFTVSSSGFAQVDKHPKSLDPRLEIVQFAAAPDIVHPIAVDFDTKGRLLVVESHTHFRPKGYKGPETDRIRIVEDTDGDGKADTFTTFYDGLKATMDLAVHPDGSVYVATRNEILRLRDTKGTGKADEATRIVFLETKGDYPHNGLSGLCFDFKGDLYFGLGENLGESYALKGQGGTALKGGGEGGNIYWCTADGKNLRRVATGFWNPFGICRDVFGRVFAVDNDPDSRPPCRLVHVVEGGDYGYQFRYGRSGRHPFQAWNGELPGTLPYVAGVGEAPCEVLAYESDGLPKDYLGTLLVTSWGDHRLECYPVKTKGHGYTAEKKVVIQGGTNFRPVGLAVAPDGSLFMSDWVRRDYNLHGQGAIWHVRKKERVAPVRPTQLNDMIFSFHRPLRDSAARQFAMTDDGRRKLRNYLESSQDERVRATSLIALLASNEKDLELTPIAKREDKNPIRELAVLSIIERKEEPWPAFFDPISMEILKEQDSQFVRHLAIKHLATKPNRTLELLARNDLTDRQRVGLFLAGRNSGHPDVRKKIPEFLECPIDDIRFLTAKWISDEVIKEAREPLEKAMQDPNLNSRLYFAFATALARINGEPVDGARLNEMFLRRAKDEKATPAARVAALRMVPAMWNGLATDQLVKWTTDPSPEMRLEAVRALCEQSNGKRSAVLLAIVKDAKADGALRREAMVGVADQANAALFVPLVAEFGADAWRGLVNVPLKDDDKKSLETLAANDAASKPFVDRLLGRPLRSKEGQAADVDVWLKRLEGKGDPDAGRRVFFHPRVGACFKCHRVDGRGANVGPDLSTIGQREKKFILESILLPSREVAPQFQTWQVESADGKVRTGLLVHTDVDQATYVDEKGQKFTVPVHETETRAVPTSIMPDGLAGQLTDQELRDLLAYLTSRK